MSQHQHQPLAALKQEPQMGSIKQEPGSHPYPPHQQAYPQQPSMFSTMATPGYSHPNHQGQQSQQGQHHPGHGQGHHSDQQQHHPSSSSYHTHQQPPFSSMASASYLNNHLMNMSMPSTSATSTSPPSTSTSSSSHVLHPNTNSTNSTSGTPTLTHTHSATTGSTPSSPSSLNNLSYQSNGNTHFGSQGTHGAHGTHLYGQHQPSFHGPSHQHHLTHSHQQPYSSHGNNNSSTNLSSSLSSSLSQNGSTTSLNSSYYTATPPYPPVQQQHGSHLSFNSNPSTPGRQQQPQHQQNQQQQQSLQPQQAYTSLVPPLSDSHYAQCQILGTNFSSAASTPYHSNHSTPYSSMPCSPTLEFKQALEGQKPKRRQVKNACVNCQKACKKCDEGRPCTRCIKYGLTDTCVDSTRKVRKKGVKRGPYKRRPPPGQIGSASASTTPTLRNTLPSSGLAQGYASEPVTALNSPTHSHMLPFQPSTMGHLSAPLDFGYDSHSGSNHYAFHGQPQRIDSNYAPSYSAYSQPGLYAQPPPPSYGNHSSNSN